MNTSSGSVVGIPRTGDYAAAKGAVLALTRVLANELRVRPQLDIKVNAIMPVAQTPLLPVSSDPVFAAIMDTVYAPARVAPFVALLCHELAPCSGETFTVGGGRVARVLLQTTSGHVSHDPTPEDFLEHFDTVMAGEDPRESMVRSLTSSPAPGRRPYSRRMSRRCSRVRPAAYYMFIIYIPRQVAARVHKPGRLHERSR